jgi:hypothetical protein
VIEEFYEMKQDGCSCLNLELMIRPSWIDRFLISQQVRIPISDAYTLVNLKIIPGLDTIALEAEIEEKPGSEIRIHAIPEWISGEQRIVVSDIQIQMISKNIILKTAGWFARTFMTASIDKKLEEAAAGLFNHQKERILENGIQIPIPDTGSLSARVLSVTITSMKFTDDGIAVKSMIEGYWKLIFESEKAEG